MRSRLTTILLDARGTLAFIELITMPSTKLIKKALNNEEKQDRKLV
jgi:hypothetical protein